MKHEEICKWIEESIHNINSLLKLNRNDNLIILGIDSIEYITLMSKIEDKFNITIPDPLLNDEQFSSIEKIAEYIESQMI